MEIPCSIENIDRVEQHRRRPLESILIYTHWDILLLFEFCWISSWKSTYGDYYLTPEKKHINFCGRIWEVITQLKKNTNPKNSCKGFWKRLPQCDLRQHRNLSDTEDKSFCHEIHWSVKLSGKSVSYYWYASTTEKVDRGYTVYLGGNALLLENQLHLFCKV